MRFVHDQSAGLISEPDQLGRYPDRVSSLRLGHCCSFLEEPIKFRRTTVRYASTLKLAARRQHYREIAQHNAEALHDALAYCVRHGIGAFRLCNHILPVPTHPKVGYRLEQLDKSGDIRATLEAAGEKARQGKLRLSMHPDQFVVLGSATEASVDNSLTELELQAEVAALVGAEQLTVHGGGAAGGKPAALERLRRGLDRLSESARALVAFENDDRTFHVEDLLPICRADGVPLVYDVHHHRCLPDGLSVEEATEAAAETWRGREPWAHLSSPKLGWNGSDPRPHADYIDPADVPRFWLDRAMTVDVEAKAKELAVLRLQTWLKRRRGKPSATTSPSPPP